MLSEINISIIIISIVITLYIAVSNGVRRFRYFENKILIAICLLGAIQFVLMLLQLVYSSSMYLTLICRLYYSVVLVLCVAIYALIQVFPRWDRMPFGLVNILIMTPGIIFAFLLITSGYVIEEVRFEGSLVYVFGPYAFLYYVAQFLYFVGTFVVLIYKNRHEQNESFKRQFAAFLIGISVFGFLFTLTFVALPFYSNIHDFTPIGTASFWLALFIMVSYSTSDELLLDYRKLYLRAFLGLVVFFSMLIPAYSILRSDLVRGFLGVSSLTVSSSILLPIVFFAVFWIIRPLAEYILNLDYIKLEKDFAMLYKEVSRTSEADEREKTWDYPLNREINMLVRKFEITNAFFYIKNPVDGRFYRTHYTDIEAGPPFLEENHTILDCLRERRTVFEKSMLLSDESLRKYMDDLFPFISEHGIQVAIPVVNLDRELYAVLFLGRFRDDSLYRIEFIEHLKRFADQFGFTLVKCITFENARKIQVVEHDKLVIASIKKRIIPENFDQIQGIRISSLFMDNSEFGGDYFDAVKISANRAGILAANTFDAGINSSMLALQMFTIFHGHAVRYDSSEKLLNLMNQAIATAKYSEKHASAFYMIFSASGNEISYSNAAYNPLLLFDTGRDIFSEYTTDGLPLGVDGRFVYKAQTAKLPAGSVGLLYSDGISSAVDKDGNAYSVSRIMDIVKLNKTETPAKIVRLIHDDLQSFTGGSPMVNDASIVVFRVFG